MAEKISSGAPFFDLPYLQDPDFVGRTEVLDRIEKKCAIPGARVALVGDSGVGKTHIALEYAHRVQAKSPKTEIFWVDGSTVGYYSKTLREHVKRLGIVSAEHKETSVLQLLQIILDHEHAGQWLMLVDGVEAMDAVDLTIKDSCESLDTDSTTPGLLPLLREASRGSTLFTMRPRVLLEFTELEHQIVEIGPMSSEEAFLLFSRTCRTEVDEPKGRVMLELLSHNPLSIHHAAMFISQPGLSKSVDSYLHRLRRIAPDIQGERDTGSLKTDDLPSKRHSFLPIALTWQIAFETVIQERKSLKKLLFLMSHCHCWKIPMSVLQIRGQPTGEYEVLAEDLAYLESYGLVKMCPDSESVNINSEVQKLTREWLQANDDADAIQSSYLRRISSVIPAQEGTDREEGWEACATLFPHAASAGLITLKGVSPWSSWSKLLRQGAWFAYANGQRTAAKGLVGLSSTIKKKTQEERFALCLALFEDLAFDLNECAMYVESELLYRHILVLRKQSSDPEISDTTATQTHMASSLKLQGRYREAVDVYRQVFETKSRTLGLADRDTLQSLDRLGNALRDVGDVFEAESAHRQALEVQDKQFGREDLDTMMSMNNLGIALRCQNKNEEAESIHRETIVLREKILGPDHIEVLRSMNNFATALSSQGRRAEAEELFREIVARKERSVGLDHESTVQSVFGLAWTLYHAGKYEESEALHKRAFAGFVESLGHDHPKTRNCRQSYDYLLQSMAEHKAREQEAEVFPIEEIFVRAKL